MRKLKLDKKGVSPMVAVIVLLTLVLVLGAIIAGTLSGAPRPVMPATTAVNIAAPQGANPSAGDTTLILRHEYGKPLTDAWSTADAEHVDWGTMVLMVNDRVVDAKFDEEYVFTGTHASLITGTEADQNRIKIESKAWAAGNKIWIRYNLLPRSAAAGVWGDARAYVGLVFDPDATLITVSLAVKSTLTIGEGDSAVTYWSEAYPHPSVAHTNDTMNDADEVITVSESTITVELADDGENIVSTAAEVVAAVNANPDAFALVTAELGDGGTGIAATQSATRLGASGVSIATTEDVVAAINTQVSAYIVASVIDSGGLVAPEPLEVRAIVMDWTQLSGGVDPDYMPGTYDFELGDRLVIDIGTPLESGDMIQLLWEPRDLTLVSYLVQ